MLSQFSNEKKKEEIIGFFTLSDGSFLKVYNNQHIEICKGFSSKFIKIEKAPSKAHVEKAELPNDHLALVYTHNDSNWLVILDLKKGIPVANKTIEKIFSLKTLANGSMLINGDTLCVYKNNRLTVTKADEFIDFRDRQPFDNHENDDSVCFGPSQFHPLPSQPGFIYFDNHYQSKIQVITDQFEKKAEFEFRAPRFHHLAPRRVHGQCNLFPAVLGFCYASHVLEVVLLSDQHFACLTRDVNYDKTFKYHLYIINTDLKQFHEKNIMGRQDSNEIYFHDYNHFIRIDDEHIAYVRPHKAHQTCVRIYNLKCEKVKKIIIDKRMVDHFIAVTRDGQLATCNSEGEIVIHNIFPLREQLKKETEFHLTKKYPKTSSLW